jgi:predicted DNA-binding antitoxin AbrB/MazE fold protein
MAQVIEAIYTNGMLKVVGRLPLEEQQRVRLIIEPLDADDARRQAAVARFKAGVASSSFRSEGRPLPRRDELHDRV